MGIGKFFIVLIAVGFAAGRLQAQTIRGKVLDEHGAVPMFAASVGQKGTTNGALTDFDGEFSLQVESLPVTLVVSYIGYIPKEVLVTSADSRVFVELAEDAAMLSEVEVVADRISDRQKQAPLTVESMDLIAIREAPSGNFYESLGNLKGVDLTTASLGFRVINTRGFNSTSPVRTLQLIDGVDNQSPGLNFSLGNFLGAPDLDVKGVEIIQGASSAFYGPGAFNGVIFMETKNPFVFEGLSAQLRVGERNLVEPQIRWAQKFANRNGQDVLAYKFNLYYLRADDWEAENYEPVFGSRDGATNPGRFDAVNVYGDEYFAANDFSTAAPWNYRGIGTFYRTGYRESDVVDYNTRNLKANAALHWRLRPDDQFNSPELIIGGNLGTGTTVYQGDNRFSLRDILFYQGKVELRKKDRYFIRAYATGEDAGKSYDPYFTSLRLLEEARSNEGWAQAYVKYWQDSINGRVSGLNYPGLVQNPDWGPGDPFTEFFLPYDYNAQAAWLDQYSDSLIYWHGLVEDWTNTGNAGIPGITQNGFLQPGSRAFEEAFDRITSAKNNQEERGTRFFDRSALYHLHGEYQWEDRRFISYRVGANGRMYRPFSDGTIFSDSAARIVNSEWGVYTGVSRKFDDGRLIASATVRADKNQNFSPVISPAASLVWLPAQNHTVRVSFSSALRNPTLTDQYLYLNVGPAILSGNLNGVSGLITIPSFQEYRRTLNTSQLRYFDINPIRPEQVRTLEAGYRGTIAGKIYVDGGFYTSWYNHFIGYNIGIDAAFDQGTGLPSDIQVYRYSANALSTVRTQGFNVGANYYYHTVHSFNVNYSWNRIAKADESDPIIPAFNTPEHKINLGISARDWLKRANGNSWGYGVNYKWIEEFLFEGSPQFTGTVPTYSLVDAQVNYTLAASHIQLKVGASNLLNNRAIQTYGGPAIGRLAYLTVLFEPKSAE
jgi:iron complex outermembrane recepter protein